MIVVAIIAIILTLALPVYTTYSIRAKVGEALSAASVAKTTVDATCVVNPTLTDLDNDAVGYVYGGSTWVDSITVSEDCLEPVITLVTRNTGAPAPAPLLKLTGIIASDGGKVTWTCASPNAPNYFLPPTCRN